MPYVPSARRTRALAAGRLAAAALILAAVLYQLTDQIRANPNFSVMNFFSFFTILSNLVAAAVFVLVASRGTRPRPAWLDLFRGAAVLYMTTTGVVFAVLLADISAELDLTVPWVDSVLHQIMPVLVLLDWLVDPPRATIRSRTALSWLVFPAAYGIYSLLRGPSANWYPYPFIDPREQGYAAVALNCAGIAVGVVVLTALIVWAGNRLRGARRTSSSSPT